MVEEIAGLVTDLGLSALYVTHDQAEAFSLADEVAVMRNGQIEQLAAPEDLVAAPATPYVAEFLRLGALLPVTRGPSGWHLEDGLAIAPSDAVTTASRVLIPSRAVRITAPAAGTLTARVVRMVFRGDAHVVIAELPGGHRLQITTEGRLSPDSRIGLRIPLDALCWF